MLEPLDKDDSERRARELKIKIYLMAYEDPRVAAARHEADNKLTLVMLLHTLLKECKDAARIDKLFDKLIAAMQANTAAFNAYRDLQAQVMQEILQNPDLMSEKETESHAEQPSQGSGGPPTRLHHHVAGEGATAPSGNVLRFPKL